MSDGWGQRDVSSVQPPPRPRFTPTQTAFLKACYELTVAHGPGVAESDVEKRAWQIETPRPTAKRQGAQGIHDHYSNTPEALVPRGLLRKVRVGNNVSYRLTDEGWQLFEPDGRAPEDPEQPLFS